MEELSQFSFLGREFLTWLWFKSEERGGSVSLPGIGDLEIIFSRKIVLESGEGEYSESVQCQGLHANLTEGRTALKQGKKVKEARIQLHKGELQWEFTFKADDFRFQSLRLPQMMSLSEESEGLEGRILERVALVQEIMETMDALFDLFLKERCSPDWKDEALARIRRWIRQD